jgi:hypothetical protein
LLEADRRFFDGKTLEERLEAPTRVIRDWVTTHKPVVKARLWRALEHNCLHNRDLREFFETVQRAQVTTSSDDDDEDCCTDDVVETSNNGSSSSEDNSSSDGDSSSESGNSSSLAGDGDQGTESEKQRGFMQLIEQKITNFF